MTLSHDVDFIEIEEMKKNIYVPQNMQGSALVFNNFSLFFLFYIILYNKYMLTRKII